jgi:uncharacterized protein (TIGR03086 family)
MTQDMHPSAQRMAELVRNVSDSALADPTPCSEYKVGDLLDHISGFATAIARVATKTVGYDPTDPGSSANLGADWRERIPAELLALAVAWDDPAAYEGMTGGPIDMPAEMAAVVAVEELCIHGWDLARATGQPFEATDVELDAVDHFYSLFSANQRGDAYGPGVETASPSRLDRAIATSGRDPGWRA